MQKFFIDGPAGKIETVLAEPQNPPRGLAVIAHPHPLHGGTMENKVVQTLFRCLLELGFIAVKFNFRGVGNSEGVHDDGIGEIDDTVHMAQTIQQQFDHQYANIPLLLAGFSFGGGVQLHAAQRLNPQSLILVAPSVHATNAPPPHTQTERVLIIHGNQDEIIPLDTLLQWATPHSLPIMLIPGASHFFHGKLIVLKRIINTFFKIPS